ncbi:MAG: YlxM family DNA-binding protein [Eubacteriales bacterium]|nr:YlxM family DNA-binding protein [Eubacteriales bacterium]
MEKIYEEALLFDFYGELLTDRQRQIYEEVVLDDYSLSEVAEEYGITRQGVHDMIRRCTASLNGYEEKLGLVKRFLDLKKKAAKIRDLTDNEEIRKIAGEILEEL